MLLDGTDCREIPFSVLHRDIAVAAQKPLLFTGTIADNIRWGKEDASDEEVHAAARAAMADEFICGKPDGYGEMLGQNGTGLSGGQKQRLSLARELIRKPAVLILDDVTSALDADTESAVLRNLAAIKDTTVFLISQRIATVRRADHILVLDDGRMQGFGTHEELLAICPAYQAIYESQIGKRIGNVQASTAVGTVRSSMTNNAAEPCADSAVPTMRVDSESSAAKGGDADV